MSRQRYIQHPETLKLVPAEEYQRPTATFHYVMPDIAGYTSMVDGSWISSRSHHRNHLRQHNCIEVGNEKITPPQRQPDKTMKQDILRAMYEKGVMKP
jgi:hypothetical protein